MQVGLMLTSENLDQLATALSAAQGEIKDASKDSVNPHLKSKYADLAEVLQTARPILSKFGLSIIQGVAYDDGQVRVTSRLLHKSGQWVESMISIPVVKQDAQGIGSATTYGRRYGGSALIGISQDDDDGESVKAAQARKKQEPGSGTQNQVPENQPRLALVLGPVAQAMVAKFNLVGLGEHPVGDELLMKQLTEEYSSLTPVEQTQVLPAAKAARNRLEAAKTTTAK